MGKILSWLFSCALLALLHSPCLAAISATNINTAVGSTGTTLTISGVTVAAGSLVVVATNEHSNACGSLSDGTNNYTKLTSGSFIGAFITCVFYHYYPSGGLSGATLTFTRNQSGSNASMSALYVSGSNGGFDASVTAVNSGTSQAPTVTSGPSTVAGELVLAIVGYDTAATFTAAASFPAPFDAAIENFASTAGGNFVNPSASTTVQYNSAAANLLGSISDWGAITVGVKPAVSSALCTIASMGAGPC